MNKGFLACCTCALFAVGCSSKSESTPAATETTPITGLPANTAVLSGNPSPGSLPVVQATAAALMPAPEAAPGTHGITYSGVQLDQSLASTCKIPAPKAYFEYDSANIKGGDMGSLDALATCLSTGPLKGKAIEIIGHTDERGDAEYNKQLGYSRAQSVANYIETKGADKAKIGIISKGLDNAKAKTNDTTGMAYDRRVDIRIKK